MAAIFGLIHHVNKYANLIGQTLNLFTSLQTSENHQVYDADKILVYHNNKVQSHTLLLYGY